MHSRYTQNYSLSLFLFVSTCNLAIFVAKWQKLYAEACRGYEIL